MSKWSVFQNTVTYIHVVYCQIEDSTQKDHEGDLSTPPVNVLPTTNLPPTAGLSAEDVQKIATAVAVLVGRPGASSNSKNPLVSGRPSQVPVPPSACRYATICRALPAAFIPVVPFCTYDMRCLELFCFGWACLVL